MILAILVTLFVDSRDTRGPWVSIPFVAVSGGPSGCSSAGRSPRCSAGTGSSSSIFPIGVATLVLGALLILTTRAAASATVSISWRSVGHGDAGSGRLYDHPGQRNGLGRSPYPRPRRRCPRPRPQLRPDRVAQQPSLVPCASFARAPSSGQFGAGLPHLRDCTGCFSWAPSICSGCCTMAPCKPASPSCR